MNFQTAVVIGKFYPPHRGHKFLIDTAAAEAKHVTVIVCAKAEHGIPGYLRGEWIRKIHPNVEVKVIDDIYDDNDSPLWAKLTIEWLGYVPEAVFTSEDYGERYAALMGSQHRMVDRQRNTVPCSGTAIRTNPLEHWEYMEPVVRTWFVKRICIVGAESTGTTTLAKSLAKYFQTVWIPEYGREYSVQKTARGELDWKSDEFVHIAQEQCRQEDEAVEKANKFLICDTNAFATCLWHRRYLGFDHDSLKAISKERHYDLYLLTGDEIPFEQDGTRDGEHIRHQMHQWFVEALQNQKVPWSLVSGSQEDRMKQAISKIKEISK